MLPVGIDPKMSASGGEVELAGKKYYLEPLTDKDYGEFENWLRLRPIIIARQNIAAIPGITQEEKEILLKEAMRLSAEINMVSVEGMRVMNTLDGAAYVTWLGLRKRQPELTFDKVRELLMDPKTLETAMTEYERNNELAGLKKGGPKGTDQRLKAAVDSTVSQLSSGASTSP